MRAGHIDAARVLLDAGAEINEKLPDGTSALLLAIMNAHYEAAGVLVDRGADPNADAQGWAPLHQVVWSGGRTPASTSPARPTGSLDSLELVRKLLQHGANVNARLQKEPRDGFRNAEPDRRDAVSARGQIRGPAADAPASSSTAPIRR